MIVSWPGQITTTGLRRQYVHAVDIVPTIYSLLGIEPPEVVKGYTQFPLEGVSFDATLNDATATTDKQTQFYSMGGTRAIWNGGWKAAAISPAGTGRVGQLRHPALGTVQHRRRPHRVPRPGRPGT